MPYTTINKSTDNFETNLYTANGSGKTISGMNFKPDFIWTKNRDNGSYIPAIVDAVRGGTKKLFTNGTTAETTDSNAVTSFTSDGYVFGSSGSFNYGTDDYVNWCLKAGGGQGSSNTDGSINTTYTSVNTTAGFSVSQYTGNQTSGASVGHGLGVAPKMIIVKSLSEAHNWRVYHKSIGATKEFYLDTTAVPYTATNIWNDQEPTSSVFYLGNNDTGTNKSGVTYVAYCFAEKSGYSKISSYIGNGNVEGTFVYTGFKPNFVLIKNTSDTANWTINDTARDPGNVNNLRLFPNTGDAENSGSNSMDMLSNGFKLRSTDSGNNGSGHVMIYMAIGQSIVGSNNIPATAR